MLFKNIWGKLLTIFNTETALNIRLVRGFPIPSRFESIYHYYSTRNATLVTLLVASIVCIGAYYLLESLIVLLFYILGIVLSWKEVYQSIFKIPYIVMYQRGLVYQGKTYEWGQIQEPIEYIENNGEHTTYFIRFQYDGAKVQLNLISNDLIKIEHLFHYFYCYKHGIYKEMQNIDEYN